MFFHVLLIVLLCCVSKSEERSTKFKPLDKNVNVEFSSVGCYADRGKPRMFRKLYFNARTYLGKKLWKNWPDMSEAIRLCAEQAYTHGYREMFAVQNYGECWSDSQASTKYTTYGKSNACKQGVGAPLANSVYRIKVVNLAESSTCLVNGRNYSEGDSMKMVNEYSSVENAICQQCTCSRGKPAKCRNLHYCDLHSKQCEKYVIKPGICCPVCDCFHAGHAMSAGEKWVKRTDTSCAECTCQENGRALCHLRRVFCPVCDYPVPVEGQCCPKCVRIDPTLPPDFEIPTTTARPDPSWEHWNDQADVTNV